MGEACCGGGSECSTSPSGAAESSCPVCGVIGKSVTRTTVSALTTGLVPPRQNFRICRESACSVVYYGSLGAQFEVGEMRMVPGFKEGSDGCVCYCYHHSRESLALEIERTGKSNVIQEITAEVQAGNCACDVRNPTGTCCLGEVQRTLKELKRASAEIAGA